MKVYDARTKIYYKMTVEMPNGEYREFNKDCFSTEWYETVSYDIHSSLEPIEKSFSDKLDILWEEYQREEEIPDNER